MTAWTWQDEGYEAAREATGGVAVHLGDDCFATPERCPSARRTTCNDVPVWGRTAQDQPASSLCPAIRRRRRDGRVRACRGRSCRCGDPEPVGAGVLLEEPSAEGSTPHLGLDQPFAVLRGRGSRHARGGEKRSSRASRESCGPSHLRRVPVGSDLPWATQPRSRADRRPREALWHPVPPGLPRFDETVRGTRQTEGGEHRGHDLDTGVLEAVRCPAGDRGSGHPRAQRRTRRAGAQDARPPDTAAAAARPGSSARTGRPGGHPSTTDTPFVKS